MVEWNGHFSIRPVRPGKEDHLKRWTSFFETFPVGPYRSMSFGHKFPEILVEWIVPIVKTDLRSQIFLLADEKAIQSLSNITFVSNDFTLLG